MKKHCRLTASAYRRTIKFASLTLASVVFLWSCEIFSGEKVEPYNPSDGISFASGFDDSSAPLKTRSLITSVDDIKFDGSRISLFGSVALSGGGVAEIFDNTELAYAAATDSWGYAPVQYWLSSATYDFAGFYPYKSSGFTHNAADKTFTYAGPYVSALSTTAQEDILVGHAVRDVAADGKGTVVLPMKHALAAVRFSVRNTSENDFTVIGQNLQGIKNRGADMTYDGTNITWNTVDYAAGTTATTPQFACTSNISTTNGTYNNTDCTVYQIRYRRNNSNYTATLSSYSRTATPSSTQYVTATVPYMLNADGTQWTANTASGNRNTANYYYDYSVSTVNGGVEVPISSTTSVPLYESATFLPNTSGYALDDNGYLLVLPQALTSDAKLKFDTAILTPATIDVATQVIKYVYGISTNSNNNSTIAGGGGTVIGYVDSGGTYYKTVDVGGVFATTTSRTVNLADLASVTRWEAGKKYDYVITVSTSDILISVTMVPWVDREIELN